MRITIHKAVVDAGYITREWRGTNLELLEAEVASECRKNWSTNLPPPSGNNIQDIRTYFDSDEDTTLNWYEYDLEIPYPDHEFWQSLVNTLQDRIATVEYLAPERYDDEHHRREFMEAQAYAADMFDRAQRKLREP